jgi:hypothetical protein
MATNSFRISGHLINRTPSHSLTNLRVEAWDKDRLYDDLVGSAVADAQGAYCIEFDESYLQELLQDRRPDLFFKFFRGDALIRSTEGRRAVGRGVRRDRGRYRGGRHDDRRSWIGQPGTFGSGAQSIRN